MASAKTTVSEALKDLEVAERSARKDMDDLETKLKGKRTEHKGLTKAIGELRKISGSSSTNGSKPSKGRLLGGSGEVPRLSRGVPQSSSRRCTQALQQVPRTAAAVTTE